MIVILTERPNFFKFPLRRQSFYMSIDDDLYGHELDNELVQQIITREPKIILFDTEFSTETFSRLWEKTQNIIAENSLKTVVGIFKPKVPAPDHSFVTINSIEDLSSYT